MRGRFGGKIGRKEHLEDMKERKRKRENGERESKQRRRVTHHPIPLAGD